MKVCFSYNTTLLRQRAMAKTISEAFRKLRENLEITGLQESTVSTRQTNVRVALKDDFDVNESFLTGSYRRNTMIAPLAEADIDMFVVLDAKYYSANGQMGLLESVKRALRKTYKTTPEIRPDGQAVTITFNDFKVDVVPAFYRQGGGFLIPNTSLGQWISTDPKKHVELWTASNKDHNGDLIPLIKMVKGWNKSRGVFKSFHLEVLTRRVLTDVKISNFPSGLRYVFDKARDHIKVKLADPAGYNDDVAAHVNTQAAFDKIVEQLTYAFNTAVEAERLGDTAAAFDKWRVLLRGYSPAYG
jgi:hypothetical protein